MDIVYKGNDNPGSGEGGSLTDKTKLKEEKIDKQLNGKIESSDGDEMERSK